MDKFEVEAVHLGELEKIVITKGPGDPWHLQKIVVKGGRFAGSEEVFLYER